MEHLDLFSGIGGFSLACQWAGLETIGFVEIDKYCQKVLKKHWPNVPIVEDIRDVERIKEVVANTQANGRTGCRATRDRWTGLADSGQNAGTGYCGNDNQPIILITAGFPCQPFSVAGKRGSTEDDRYLWPETLAVIKAIKPSWVLLENVTGIINLALDTVLSDLEGAGYSTETLIIPACAVNAWHRRDRVWVVAYSEGTRARQDNGGIRQRLGGIDRGQEAVVANTKQFPSVMFSDSGGYAKVAKPKGQGQRAGTVDGSCGERGCNTDYWAVEPGFCGMVNGPAHWMDGYFDREPDIPRVATGVKNRVDRLKCLGNAIVPAVAAQIIRAIKEVDSQWQY